jgi:hypothetical protein
MNTAPCLEAPPHQERPSRPNLASLPEYIQMTSLPNEQLSPALTICRAVVMLAAMIAIFLVLARTFWHQAPKPNLDQPPKYAALLAQYQWIGFHRLEETLKNSDGRG